MYSGVAIILWVMHSCFTLQVYLFSHLPVYRCTYKGGYYEYRMYFQPLPVLLFTSERKLNAEPYFSFSFCETIRTTEGGHSVTTSQRLTRHLILLALPDFPPKARMNAIFSLAPTNRSKQRLHSSFDLKPSASRLNTIEQLTKITSNGRCVSSRV